MQLRPYSYMPWRVCSHLRHKDPTRGRHGVSVSEVPGINSALYGEGDKAVQRLQKAIMITSGGHSLFALGGKVNKRPGGSS
ncbi:hypothetical protein LX36DRAFT_441457 [Colletotrichum falcatum]|nr:hypothetical protein LX36DRAFT_441457 [Colletotrichum falcatum]